MIKHDANKPVWTDYLWLLEQWFMAGDGYPPWLGDFLSWWQREKAIHDIIPDFQRLYRPDLGDVHRALARGTDKYGLDNFRNDPKVSWKRIANAYLRHMVDHEVGNTLDEESGLPHVAPAAANLHFLLYYSECSIGVDDRPEEK